MISADTPVIITNIDFIRHIIAHIFEFRQCKKLFRGYKRKLNFRFDLAAVTPQNHEHVHRLLHTLQTPDYMMNTRKITVTWLEITITKIG